jgi:hypothetical protein
VSIFREMGICRLTPAKEIIVGSAASFINPRISDERIYLVIFGNSAMNAL